MSFFKTLRDYFDLRKKAEKPTPPQKPEAKFEFVDGKLTWTFYNTAFIDDLKQKMGDLTDGKTDEQIMDLYLDRENLEREEPKLEVLHMGLEENGTVKMKLDWNRAFIIHLRENGIEAETEEAAIELYLQLLHRNAGGEPGVDMDSADAAFADVDAELHREFEEARAQLNNKKQKPQRGRRVNRSAPIPDSPESI